MRVVTARCDVDYSSVVDSSPSGCMDSVVWKVCVV